MGGLCFFELFFSGGKELIATKGLKCVSHGIVSPMVSFVYFSSLLFPLSFSVCVHALVARPPRKIS